MTVAATIVLSALAGGGMGATSVSASAGESGAARISRSEPNARTGRTDARTSSDTNGIKIRSHLNQQGYDVKFQADEQTNCEDYSDGDVRTFFHEHPCQVLYRQLFEIEDKKNVILIGMATIQMDDPDPQTAMDLKTLLDQVNRGKVIQLTRDSGKFRNFSFTHSLATTTVHGTTVTTYDTQVVSGAGRNILLIPFLNYVLFGVG